MPHVGNDIVDLTHPAARGKSRNVPFLRRVLTPEEQTELARASCPDALLWAFWAAKETAYKVASKIQPGVSSSPRLYRVRYDGTGEGTAGPGSGMPGLVQTPCGDVSIGLFTGREYVHCIGVAGAQAAALRRVVWEVKRMPGAEAPTADHESRFVREAAAGRLSACLAADAADIEIRRRPRPAGPGEPLVYCRGRRTAIDISLSHDGGFAAYAFLPGWRGVRPRCSTPASGASRDFA